MAVALGAKGARVALHYGSSTAAAGDTAELIRRAGADVEIFPADLHVVSEATNLVERAVRHFGRVDILVNSAAIFQPGGLADTTEESWDAHFTLNLKAPFFLCQAFARQLRPDGAGCIVNIADWRAVRPGPDYLAYTLTKAGIVTMTESLAQALAPNIRVNAIAPGAILPPPGGTEADLARRALRIPLRRSGTPEEVVRALIYLLEAEFVTGQVMFVDGGERFTATVN
jgi:glucose 1-dehydrogenase